jgi:hypothetical protein
MTAAQLESKLEELTEKSPEALYELLPAPLQAELANQCPRDALDHGDIYELFHVVRENQASLPDLSDRMARVWTSFLERKDLLNNRRYGNAIRNAYAGLAEEA